MNELDQCLALLVEHHPEHHLAALFSRPDKRRHATGLLTAIAEIRAIPRDCRDTNVAVTKLAWWQQECARLAEGEPRHPATRCLLDHPTLAGAPHWHDLLDAVARDVRYDAYPGEAELDDLAHRLGQPVTGLFALLDGTAADAELQRLIARADWLCQLRAHAGAGRLYLPLDHLAAHDLAPESLHAPTPGERLGELLHTATTTLIEALAAPHQGTPTQRVLGALALAELHHLRRHRWRSWPTPRPGWRRVLTAWNAARKAASGP
ncbi:MAG: squalene/phytoene synthase family protein [Gammaproteobacteria bacterium]|nr:squalene/phytoene synthase family protein [Gammaproteobacteria bacterium]